MALSPDIFVRDFFLGSCWRNDLHKVTHILLLGHKDKAKGKTCPKQWALKYVFMLYGKRELRQNQFQ